MTGGQPLRRFSGCAASPVALSRRCCGALCCWSGSVRRLPPSAEEAAPGSGSWPGCSSEGESPARFRSPTGRGRRRYRSGLSAADPARRTGRRLGRSPGPGVGEDHLAHRQVGGSGSQWSLARPGEKPTAMSKENGIAPAPSAGTKITRAGRQRGKRHPAPVAIGHGAAHHRAFRGPLTVMAGPAKVANAALRRRVDRSVPIPSLPLVAADLLCSAGPQWPGSGPCADECAAGNWSGPEASLKES